VRARVTARHLAMVAASVAAGVLLARCGGGGSPGDNVRVKTFAPVDALTKAEVERIVDAAARSIDAPRLAIAVVDRIGNILMVWNRDPGSTLAAPDNAIATSLARTAAYMSHSQAPLTSRTEQFLNANHFPATFDTRTYGFPDVPMGADPSPLAPQRLLTGVRFTGLAPLFLITYSNRGGTVLAYGAEKEIPLLTNPDGTRPTPGFTPLPGGVPLYKSTAGPFDVKRRLVGAIGVYSTDAAGDPLPELSEFAAFAGSQVTPDFSFGPIPLEGAVFLGGILLPYVGQATRPAGFGEGDFDGLVLMPAAGGKPDPFDYLIAPRDSATSVFTAAEVRTLVEECVRASNETHAAIRLPAESACQMFITVTDLRGEVLALFRQEDATLFSLEISLSKARNAVYFSDRNSVDCEGPRKGQHPLAGIVPPGTAVTARTLGFLATPFYPPVIDGNEPGPLRDLAEFNAIPQNFNRMGFAPPVTDDSQSGIIFFPGSAPLYRNGVLIGGLGVSGDGVEQDDLVTSLGIQRAQRILGFTLEPPPEIRCDRFEFRDVKLPYFKFPQNPGG